MCTEASVSRTEGVDVLIQSAQGLEPLQQTQQVILFCLLNHACRMITHRQAEFMLYIRTMKDICTMVQKSL